jgi:hypothetical protein
MFNNVTTVRSYLDNETGGAGSLTSYYEDGVESQGPSKRANSTNVFAGNRSMFPQLDVMPGAASAVNEGVTNIWGFSGFGDGGKIDIAKLLYEETLGELDGFRLNHDTGFNDDDFNMLKFSDKVFEIENDNLELHSGQAPHGQHNISMDIASSAKDIATQHAMGDSQAARKRGLQRGENPAVNGSIGEEAFHNSEVIPVTNEYAMPMDIDVIEVNDEEVRVEDTQYALDGNVAS